jgi:LuxR family maltose regulon positive regulatory protein
MKSSILLNTKFMKPRLSAEHIPRPHLIQWLENQQDQRLILISAPPGYGKTTLLLDYIRQHQRPIAWYQMDAADSDPTVFLACLIEAIRRMESTIAPDVKSIGQAALSLLDSGKVSSEPQRILSVFINDMTEQIHEPFLVILEDYHFVANPTVHQLIDILLENGPSNLHLVISTRLDPPLGLPRLRARGQMAELRTADLRFRDEEVCTWILRVAPGLSHENVSLLCDRTEGWAAAVQIVQASIKGRDDRSAHEIIAGLTGSQRIIFEYLAEEVFRRQPKERQQFLISTAVLNQMDAAVCNAILGRQNAQEILEELEKQNLFVSSIDPQRYWYRYHYLFREFLLSKLRTEQPEQLRTLEQATGRYYEKHSELEVAFWYYLEAEDFQSAAQVATKFAPIYVEQGRIEVLHRVLSSLPMEVQHGNPELQLQHGNVHRLLGEAGMAISAYDDARRCFSDQANASGISRSLTRLAEVHRSQGNYQRAEEFASQALSAAVADDHVARAEALIALAKSTSFMTGMDQGRRLAEQAVEEARMAGDQISSLARAAFIQSLGQICWWHGDPQATVRYCLEALLLAPDELSPLAAQACILLVSPYLYWRELETALRYAERGLHIAQTLHLNELLPAAYTALGNVLTRLGETTRAETALRQSVELAQRLGMASYEQLMATGYLAYNLSGQGRVDEAWQLAEGALWVYTGSPDSYEAFVCRSVLADVALEKVQLSRAEALYNNILEIGTRRQFRIPLALVHFGLSYIHLVTDRPESGLAHAQEALRLIEPTKAFQLFIDQGERSRVVCQALLEAGSQSEFIQRVIEHLPGKNKMPSIVISSPSVVHVRCMGDFQVVLGRIEISQDRWISSKARDLLAFFITFRNERIPAERAFDAIWAEKPGRGLTAFHTALSRLRSALRTDEASPRLILVESGEYRLDGAHFSIDIEEFDSSLAKAHAISDDETSAHYFEQAVNLYRGEYLHNLYYDWLFPERRRLTQAYLSALRSLADFHYANTRYTNALELLNRALWLDNLQEDLHCQLMRVYAALGDRAGLVRQYQELSEILKAEMNLEPLAATRSLYDRLVRMVED